MTAVEPVAARRPLLPAPPARPAPSVPAFTELNTRRLGPVRRYFLRHPVMMDVLLSLAVGIPAVVSVVFRLDGASPVALVLGIVGAGVLMWRRHHPEWVAAAIGVLAAATLASTGNLNQYDLAIGFAVYAVAAARPARSAWLTFLALGVITSLAVVLFQAPGTGSQGGGFTVGPEEVGSTGDARASSITSLIIFSLAAIAIGSNVRNRRVHVAALVERANGLAIELQQQIDLAAAAERTRIAREMHDVVAHSLSVMIALADGAGVALERSPERAREAVDALSATGRSALADMRRVLGVLRDPQAPLGPQPRAADLTELVEGFRSAGLPVRTSFTQARLPTDTSLQLTVYRIVQESLTNVLRHARGPARVDLTILYSRGWIDITVTDSGSVAGSAGTGSAGAGPGRTVVGDGGKGLIGMRERAAVYGGVVEAGPLGAGWRTHAMLAWDEGGVT